MDSPEILLWGGMWDLVTSVFVRTTSFQAPVLGGGIGGVNKMVETSLAVATIVFCYLTDFMQEEQQIASSECEWPTPTPVLLPNNRYLALPVISVNKVLNMPVSTGFPLSAVSKNHAREVLKATKSDILSHPDMSPSTNCLSMADGQPLSINERVAVPLTFANGRTISFEMLVLEYLSHDIVFGQNHLEKLDATINFSSGEITFCDPDFNVTLSCNFVLPPDNAVLAMTSVVK